MKDTIPAEDASMEIYLMMITHVMNACIIWITVKIIGNMFDCQELECGKEWDGHTEEDVTRLLSLPYIESENEYDKISN